jgi:chromosome segregation ATPase
VYRPNTATANQLSNQKQALRERDSLSNIDIVKQLTGEEYNNQSQAIEIERLRTTCHSLNSKVAMVDDLKQENNMLRKRIEELKEVAIAEKKSMDTLEDSLQGYQEIRGQLEGKIQALEEERVKEAGMKKELAVMISTLEKSQATKSEENELVRLQNVEL